ncbi:MAG: exodeoxyribonuclease VII large subunit [Clostridiales bacterium]|nr:exodeoxyribonuclease VII large subunit [Clostridiales bacterium]
MRVFKVFEINRYIKSKLEEDFILNGVYIEGEVSNYKPHSSGHVYFTLKDESSSINAVMFKTAKQGLKFNIENGMKAVGFGRVSLYEKTGNYQFYVEILEPVGQGALFFAYNQLKNKLEKEGLFDSRFKKPLPEGPGAIAIITSGTGAAVRDIIKICKKRDSSIKIIVVDTIVQGENAPKEIVSSIRLVNEWGGCGLIILGRGGGSLEDLWAFNDEKVARAIFASKIPIISAIGHETDFTIADFVSDYRASTPSNAAEIAVSEKYLKFIAFTKTYGALIKTVNIKLAGYRKRLLSTKGSKYLRAPLQNIYDRQMYLTSLKETLKKATNSKISGQKSLLAHKIRVLNSLSPSNSLIRGFAVATKNKQVIKSISDIVVLDLVNVQISDGFFNAEVINVGEDNG